MFQRLGQLLGLLSLLHLGACAKKSTLFNQNLTVGCAVTAPEVFTCGVGSVLSLQVQGGEAPYQIEHLETKYDQNPVTVSWAEDAVFTAGEEVMKQNSTNRWLGYRRFLWQDTNDCATANQEALALREAPHLLAEVWRVTDADGIESTCEIRYGVSVE